MSASRKREPRTSVRGDDPPLPGEVRDAVDALTAALGDDLAALLWHGSFARGEAKADSDHDLIIILRRIDDDVLLRMRDVFRGRANWSTFVQSEEELRQFPADGRLQFQFGAILLYGDFEPPPWDGENIIADLRSLARSIRFECRYRLFHQEPHYADMEEHYRNFLRARNARMLRYAAKWAVLCLQRRELLHGRSYPITREELRARLTDPDDLAVVDIIERWAELGPAYEEDLAPLALQLDRFARRLVASLETGDTRHETRRREARVSSRVSRVSKEGRRG